MVSLSTSAWKNFRIRISFLIHSFLIHNAPVHVIANRYYVHQGLYYDLIYSLRDAWRNILSFLIACFYIKGKCFVLNSSLVVLKIIWCCLLLVAKPWLVSIIRAMLLCQLVYFRAHANLHVIHLLEHLCLIIFPIFSHAYQYRYSQLLYMYCTQRSLVYCRRIFQCIYCTVIFYLIIY